MRKKALKILILAWFCVTPLFWHLDLSKGGLGYYDTFNMAPYAVLHAAVFYALMLLSFYVEKFSLFNVLLLTLYYPAILLTNYPYLTFRDVYLHGAPARTVLTDGSLTYARSQEPGLWPSTFVFQALSTVVFGCDLVTSNYILFGSLVVALSLIICSLSKVLQNRGYAYAWVCPILFLALFGSHEFQFNHFARSHLSFTILLLFFLSFIHLKDRRGSLIQILMVASLIAMHPFQSFYVVLFLAAFVALNMLNRSPYSRKHLPLALFSIVAFSGWFLHRASSYFERGFESVFEAIFATEYAETLVKTPYISQPLPIWGMIARNYYKYSLFALIAVALLASMFVIWKRRKGPAIPHTITALISILAVSLLFVILNSFWLPDWTFYKGAVYAAFPAAFSSVIILSYIVKKRKMIIGKKVTAAILLIFAMSLSLTTTVLLFEGNQYYGELEHPSEFSPISFLLQHNQGNMTIVTSVPAYAEYHVYNTTHQILRYIHRQSRKTYAQDGNSTRLLSTIYETIHQSDFLLRGIREQLTFPQTIDSPLEGPSEILLKLDDQLVTPSFNRIYSNGYYSVYAREP